jgi:hypothetical protein
VRELVPLIGRHETTAYGRGPHEAPPFRRLLPVNGPGPVPGPDRAWERTRRRAKIGRRPASRAAAASSKSVMPLVARSFELECHLHVPCLWRLRSRPRTRKECPHDSQGRPRHPRKTHL